MIKKVAVYCRVSTGRQTTENQVLILRKYAERMEWDYEMFQEQESTRKTRPVKYALMKRLRDKEFDAVCVLKLDRWGRSNIELALEIKELFEKGVAFISVRDNIDLSTATGKLQFHIISAFAEFERDLISERTKDGLARAVANGVKLGRKPGSKDSYKRKRSGYWLRHAAPKTRKKYENLELVEKKERAESVKDRDKARRNTKSYAKHGRLKKDKCKECGSTNRTDLEFHHDDYTNYKKVDVLCKSCHYKKHGRKPPKQYPNNTQGTIIAKREESI